MASGPLISVIIPVFNGAAFLAEALESVFAQQYESLEVFVVDDGSEDDSLAIARSFAGVTCIARDHVGVSAARNAGVRAASGEWLAFLDADDRWLPGKLQAQLAAAAEEPSAGFILCHTVYRFEVDVPSWFRGPTDGASIVAHEPSAWLVRRTVFEEVGPFDEGRCLGEDTEWLSRAWDSGVAHVVSSQTLLERRIHQSNATSQIQGHSVAFAILRESVQRKQARSGDS